MSHTFVQDAFRDQHVKSNVPILFDDMTLTHDTSRGGFVLDDLKHLFEVKESSGLHARFKDFAFQPNIPRIFTSNAMDVSEFHKALPAYVWSLTAEKRRALQPNIQAAFKRSCFALVQRSLVPIDVQDAHSKARRLG